MERLNKEQYFLNMAYLVSMRSTCPRRQVGCILVSKKSHVLATGYNGVPRGMEHCIDNPCPGANLPSGTDLDKCIATHAEQNALLQCKDTEAIHYCFTTTSPCMHCIKLLLNTSTEMLVFHEQYIDTAPMKLWILARRQWFHCQDLAKLVNFSST